MALWNKREIDGAIAASRNKETWLTHSTGRRGVGSLRARVKDGVFRFYFRYVDSSGAQVQLPLPGRFDTEGKTFDDIDTKMKEAESTYTEYSLLYREHRDLREFLEQREREANDAAEREQTERQEAGGRSLAALCDAYLLHLQNQGKASVREVRGLLQRNVIDRFPRLAATPANSITQFDIRDILSALTDAGHGRAAGKTRAALRAMYAAALAAGDPGRTDQVIDATIHKALRGFQLTLNPASMVANSAAYKGGASDEGGRVLNKNELRGLTAELKGQGTLAADAVLLCLFLAGQRPQQVLRLTTKDVDLVANTVSLLDIKGRRSQPRVHTLPLAPAAREIVDRLYYRALAKALPDGPVYLFALDRAALRPERLSAAVREAAQVMREDGRIGPHVRIRLKDIRATVETVLGSQLDVPSDVLKHLLSHGLGDLQNRHYQRGDFMRQKRHAMERWAAWLADIERGEPVLPANVIALRRGRAD